VNPWIQGMYIEFKAFSLVLKLMIKKKKKIKEEGGHN